MPVRKFRSLADAERSLWLAPGDRGIVEAARRRWAVHQALGKPPTRRKPGVFKYQSVDEKQRAANRD